MKKTIPVLLLPLALACFSCQGSPSNSSSSLSSESSSLTSEESSSSALSTSNDMAVMSFLPRRVDAYIRNNQKQSLVLTYPIGDLSNIPYINLSTYYQCLLDKELTIEIQEPGVYEVTSYSGGKAIFDTVNNTIQSEDYESFINTTIFNQDDAPGNVYYDGAPFLRIASMEKDKPARPTSINLSYYGLSIIDNGEDILLPVALASAIFQGPAMLTCFYTPNAIYFINPNDPNYDTGYFVKQDKYLAELEGFYENGQRSQAQADFNYGVLCFLIDNYYGEPGRENLHYDLQKYHHLDTILAHHDEFTIQIREWMRSTSRAEYYAATKMLHDYLDDGGHTVFNSGVNHILEKDKALANQVNALLSSIHYETGPSKRHWNMEYFMKIGAYREEKNLPDLGYFVEGDTVFFTFDVFSFNQDAWKKYYAQEGAIPEDDAIGMLKKALGQYEEDTSIKNFVIDLTLNGGGSGDVVFSIMGLLGKPTYLHYYDFIADNYVTVNYDFDANFDRVFDEADKEVKYHYNFAILNSAISFSCANLLPAQAKENGIMLIGDRSGGGACAVLDACNAEGNYTRLSSMMKLSALNGKDVDDGIEPNYYLARYDYRAESYDLTRMYDIGLISNLMNLYYAE